MSGEQMPLDFTAAKTRGDLGAERAAARAERTAPGWVDRAVEAVRDFAKGSGPFSFTIEEALPQRTRSMTAPRIPRIPEHQRQTRFGTDPDTRPPMRPRDAYAAVLVVVLSVLSVIAIVAGSVVMLDDIKTQAKAEIVRQAAQKGGRVVP